MFWIRLALLLLFISATHANAQGGGGAGAFLRLGVGSRALSMGGAFTAIADDAAAVYWNPAGIGVTHSARHQGLLMYRTMSLGRSQTALAYTQNLRASGGGVGLAFIHVGVNGIDGRDLNGQHTGELTDSENALLFSFSPAIHPKLSVGITMKLLLYRLAGQSAKGFGGDIGIMAHPLDRWQVGILLRDVGTRVSWNTGGLFPQSVQRRETFPRSVVTGVAGQLWGKRGLVSLDVEKSQGDDARLRLGTEWTLWRGMAFRAGLDGTKVAAGTGFVTQLWVARLRLNYVFLTDRLESGATHVVEWEVLF